MSENESDNKYLDARIDAIYNSVQGLGNLMDSRFNGMGQRLDRIERQMERRDETSDARGSEMARMDARLCDAETRLAKHDELLDRDKERQLQMWQRIGVKALEYAIGVGVGSGAVVAILRAVGGG